MKERFFIIALITSVILFMVVSKLKLVEPYSQSEIVVINPLLNEVIRQEKIKGLNLDFYKRIEKTSNYDIDDIPIFQNTSYPFEALIVGDSSVLMGLSPGVVNQVSSKNVGFFAFPAMKLNLDLLNFVALFKHKYMTKDSIVIMVFDPKFLLVSADERQDHSELEFLIKHADLYLSPKTCVFCTASDNRHKKFIEKSIKDIFSLIYFDSAAIRFYHFLIEKYVSKRAYKQNKVDTKDSLRGARYSVKDGSIFIHKTLPNKIVKSQPPKLVKVDTSKIVWMKNSFQELNIKPIFWVPLTTDERIRQKLLSIYHRVFPGYDVLDANTFVKEGEVVEAQNRTHLANLGAIKQSEFLGNWLKNKK